MDDSGVILVKWDIPLAATRQTISFTPHNTSYPAYQELKLWKNQKKKHLSEWTTCFAEATSWSQIRISSPRRLRDRTTSPDITSANTHKGRTQTPASRKSSFWEHKPDQWRANCMLSSKWTTYLRYSCNVANIASLALLSHISVSLK